MQHITEVKFSILESLMYGAEDPSIVGMVLDSPFSDLVDLMMELVIKFVFPNSVLSLLSTEYHKGLLKN
ncbi:hypothetical protein QVD17_19832 [Tagetes erecta]|uniref:Uncharacterized protein n=1 Tax=Tagetes erecta TaxID=13708 RepID=A0AAD8NXB2_TARER|nr:hypothetical protein QVD17_19832 [Tagetes erecta]